MKIAITGGAGFIGTMLAGLLKNDGHTLRLIDLKKSEAFPENSHIADITDASALDKALAGVDVIYHLAAEHRDDVSPVQKYYDVNVKGGENVINSAKNHGIKRIIFTSSVAVYGLNAGDSRESDTPDPFNDYGRSKLESEKTFMQWAAEDASRSLGILRLVATFGPGNRGNIYTLMSQIAAGKFVMIGRGQNCKSIAYVGNVAAFLQHMLGFNSGTHLYNYADKPDLDMRNMVLDIRRALGRKGLGPQMPYAAGLVGGTAFDVAAKITGRPFPISAIRVKKFCANTVVNADKLSETGFTAPFSLRQGLQEMILNEFSSARKAA
ncbi:MAG: NAD-dependent epimerase/dehydratase family protein [Alphaproteobacteria bacterium]|nr:NAD-dependent epimerase/dehydratase family protein [Alphaproteobacteria bacterium]